MSSYGYIDGNKIIAPVAMRSRFKQVGAWHLLTDAQRAEHDWYPCDVINEGYDAETHSRSELPLLTFDKEAKRITAAYTILEKPLETVKREHKDRITVARYETEIGGILVDGQLIDTARTTQTRISQAHSLVQLDPTTTIDWKSGAGWEVLDAATVTKLALTIVKHVQTCFSKEKELHDRIDACNTVDEVLAVNWE